MKKEDISGLNKKQKKETFEEAEKRITQEFRKELRELSMLLH